jgi:hypothetical protein
MQMFIVKLHKSCQGRSSVAKFIEPLYISSQHCLWDIKDVNTEDLSLRHPSKVHLNVYQNLSPHQSRAADARCHRSQAVRAKKREIMKGTT